MNTNEHYSPHDLLPAPEPKTCEADPYEFYDKVAKHLIKDTVRIMDNGLPIDLSRVKELENTLDEVLETVEQMLANNPLIKEFQEIMYSNTLQTYITLQQGKFKKAEDFIKPFKYNDMNHRSYFMYMYARDQGMSQPTTTLPTGIPKWDAKTVKKLTNSKPLLKKLLEGNIAKSNKYVVSAMQLLGQHKADIYNKRYEDNIETPKVDIPKFNPASSKQKQELFEWLGIKSEKTSKTTGLPSFDRAEIEAINKETSNADIKEFTQAMIDHSFGAIVKNNFIKAFYEYTIEGRLYGDLKLFGTKTFRLTSSNPNLLNLPSTGSVYSKPVKECLRAEEGKVLVAIDYGALENRVIANLSKDENLSNIYLQGLDGHCMNSLYYFKEEIGKEITLTGDPVADAKNYYNEVENGNKVLKDIRQRGKGPSFGMQYGAYPAKIASSINCSLEEATIIFDRYHNELYPGVTKFREEYVEPTARQYNHIHMGLGCYIKTDNPEKDIRTITNSCSQFWSILTLLTVNKMHQLIDEKDYSDNIKIVSTIYDSIYFEIDRNPEIIRWLNDTLVPIMTTSFIENQHVPNEATAEIGPNFSDLKQIPHGAGLEHIRKLLRAI